MDKYKVVFLLYLIASTLAFNVPDAPDFSSRQNGGSHRIHKRDVEEGSGSYQEIRLDLVAETGPSIQYKDSVTHLPADQAFRDNVMYFFNTEEGSGSYQDLTTPLLDDELVVDIAPAYIDIPVTQSFRDVMLFFNAKENPHFQKLIKFCLSIVEELIDETDTANKISNAAHLPVVSFSDLIDEVFNEIKPFVETTSYLPARMVVNGHYRGKRHVSEISENSVEGNVEVHSIDIHDFKEKLTKAYQAVKPLLKNLVSEISPSVYEKFALTYFPKLQEIINDISPFVQSKILPQVQKYMKFARSIAEKLVDRVYGSYRLSNSTHINIVSISDIIEEVNTEIKPVLDLVSYLSMRMSMSSKQFRGKRDVSEVSEPTLIRHKRQLPEFMMAFSSPAIGDTLNQLSSTFNGNTDSLISKVLIPLAFDIVRDFDSILDILRVCMIAKSAYTPLLWEMMRSQTYNTPKGTIVIIPRHMYEAAEQNFQSARPIINKLLNKYTKQFFQYSYYASPEIVDLFDHMIYENDAGVDNLKDKILDFVEKHREMFRSSTSAHVYYYSINEIMKDFAPIKIGIMNLFFAYLRRNPNSLLNLAFGEHGLMHTMVLSLLNGNSRPAPVVYSRPSTSRVVRYVRRPASQVVRYVRRPASRLVRYRG